MKTTWLAEQFIKQREIIEAAETPFAKLAVFVLPIIAPLVPAFMTGLHLYKLFLEMFTFQAAQTLSFVMASIIALVLELLGYVGAISFIRSLFHWIRTRQDEYILPFALNGIAYVFYLLAMWMINYQLGKYFGTSQLVNTIIALLSFITVPTGLLAANHLNDLSDEEYQEKIRNEKREDSLERYRIKHGKNLESSNKNGNFPESSTKVPEDLESSKKVPDWRAMRPQLSKKDLEDLANLSTDNMRTYSSKTGFTYKTISNWRMRARLELGLKENE